MWALLLCDNYKHIDKARLWGFLPHNKRRNNLYLSRYFLTHTKQTVLCQKILFSGSAAQRGLWLCSFTRFLDHTQRRATVGRTPLDEWSARRRDLCLTTHNRQTSMPPMGFDPTIAAGERPYSYVLDGGVMRRAQQNYRFGGIGENTWNRGRGFELCS
jgi:hypothetical protein